MKSEDLVAFNYDIRNTEYGLYLRTTLEYPPIHNNNNNNNNSNN